MNNTTTRLCSYYDKQSELPLITQMASELGLSLNQFQRYAVLLLVKKDPTSRNNALSMASLLATMNTSLANMAPGSKFIVSSLFDPDVWTNLSRREKREISGALKDRVDSDPNFKLAKKVQRGKINQYEKI